MAKATRARVGTWLAVGTAALLIGCTDSHPDRPKTYPVTGTVTYKGEAVADANLNFQLVGSTGYASAKTDTSGNYALMTFQAGDGAVPGDYNVGITKYERAAPTGSASEEDYVPVQRGQSPAPAKNLLPAKYANPAMSGLTAKVVEGSNKFDFQLTD